MDALDDVVDPLELFGVVAKFGPVAGLGLVVHHFNELVGSDAHLLGDGVGKAVPPFFDVLVVLLLIGEIHAGEHEGLADLVVKDDGIGIGE